MGWPTGRRPGDDPEAPEAGTGHHPLLGQPHDELREGPIGQAESLAAGTSTAREPLGAPGAIQLEVTLPDRGQCRGRCCSHL